MFADALLDGTLQGFFKLIEQFRYTTFSYKQLVTYFVHQTQHLMLQYCDLSSMPGRSFMLCHRDADWSAGVTQVFTTSLHVFTDEPIKDNILVCTQAVQTTLLPCDGNLAMLPVCALTCIICTFLCK